MRFERTAVRGAMKLVGRRAECGMLDRLVGAVATGQSRALMTEQWAGGFGLPAAVRLPDGVAESFRQRLDVLPEPTRRLRLIAAADPLGDPGLVWRAGARLGIAAEAAGPAVEDGLVDIATLRAAGVEPVLTAVR